jgi:hypothetical protein
MRTIRGMSAVSAAIALGLLAVPPAHADDMALNGRFLATSNGDFATTNDVRRAIPSVRSVWIIEMGCVNVVTCSGTVASDIGWTAEITTTNGEYVVKRELPQWQPCADGTGRTVTGHQRYRFFPVGMDGAILPGSRIFGGFDTTTGESGGCSLNDKTEIQMALRLEKLD